MRKNPIMIRVGYPDEIFSGEAKTRLIPAHSVKGFRYQGFRWFVHSFDDSWRVSEYHSGFHIGDSVAPTRREAIAAAKAFLDRKGAGVTKRVVEGVIAKHGKANE